MAAIIKDGQALAKRLLADSAERSTQFAKMTGRRPALTAVLVGDDSASHTYVRMKMNRSAAD